MATEKCPGVRCWGLVISIIAVWALSGAAVAQLLERHTVKLSDGKSCLTLTYAFVPNGYFNQFFGPVGGESRGPQYPNSDLPGYVEILQRWVEGRVDKTFGDLQLSFRKGQERPFRIAYVSPLSHGERQVELTIEQARDVVLRFFRRERPAGRELLSEDHVFTLNKGSGSVMGLFLLEGGKRQLQLGVGPAPEDRNQSRLTISDAYNVPGGRFAEFAAWLRDRQAETREDWVKDVSQFGPLTLIVTSHTPKTYWLTQDRGKNRLGASLTAEEMAFIVQFCQNRSDDDYPGSTVVESKR